MPANAPPASCTLRHATRDDSAALITLINAAFKEETDAFYKRDRMDGEMLDELFASGEIVVAEEDGAIIGCVHVKANGARAFISTLTVAVSRRGGGLGDYLLTAGHTRAAELGCRVADGAIMSRRPDLVPFYLKRGYRVTGEGPFPYPEETKVPCYMILVSCPL